MMDQIRKMEQMKQDINTMSTSSNSMFNSLGDVMAYLNNLEEEFGRLRQDCGKLQGVSKEISSGITKIEQVYIRKATY